MDLTDVSFEELRGIAESLDGYVLDKRMGEVKLRDDLTTWIEANPDKLGVKLPDPDITKPQELQEPPKKEMPKGSFVNIQSAYRGEISSSFGMLDFGKDGILEVSHDCAEMLLKLKGYEIC